MSCLDKRHVSQGGGMQGHYKYTDGFSDTSSVGSFMDDTDREVSSLTDRAFRSLCIGDEAVYNDSEFASSPVEAFSLDAHNMNILKFTAQEAFSLGVKQNGGRAEGDTTFQQSILDIAKKELKNDYVPHSSNGAIDSTWQQNSSMPKESSGGTTRDGHQRGQMKVMKDLNCKNSSSELWGKSILQNIQGELSEACAAGHYSLKGGYFNQSKNHFHSFKEAAPKTVNKDMETPSAKPSKSKRGKSSKLRKPSSNNFFLHSEHSPFESWRDSNKFLFQQNHKADLSTNERPKWYDSPLYKELTAEHGLRVPESKEIKLHQKKTEDVVDPPALPPTASPSSATPPSSVVLQKHVASPSSATPPSSVVLQKPYASPSSATLPSSVVLQKPYASPSFATLPSPVVLQKSFASPSSATLPSSVVLQKPYASPSFATLPSSVVLQNTVASPSCATPPSSMVLQKPVVSPSCGTPPSSVLLQKPVTSPSSGTLPSSVVLQKPVASPSSGTLPSSVVLQKPTAMEKRSESESGAVCPPWRRKRNLASGTLPGSRPSTVAPCGETGGRSEEASMVRASGAVTAVTPITALTAVTSVVEPASNSSTPFSISQLLTPVIHARQGTETSEVLQFALSPASLDLDLSPFAFADTAAKPAPEVKLRNNYKAIASSLLFNLKDNRKRVKSTYSPTKFKTAELSKQPSKPETAVPKNAPAISEVPVAEASASLQPKASSVRPVSELALEPTDGQTVDHKKHADGGISDDYLTLSSPHTVNEAAVYRGFCGIQENTLGPAQHAGIENGQYSGLEQTKSSKTPLWERQGYLSLNMYKAASTTEAETKATMPVKDMPLWSLPVKNRGGMKETYPLRGEDFTKRSEVTGKENRSGQNEQDGGERHDDREELHVNKHSEKSHVKTEALSVKDGDKFASREKSDPKNQFAEPREDSVKQDELAQFEKYYPTETSLAGRERERPKQAVPVTKEKERARKEGRANHVFSARQNQYIKNARYAMRDDDEGDRADGDKDALTAREDRHSRGEVPANTEHQNGKPRVFPVREMSIAGDVATPTACESLRETEHVRNEMFANDRDSRGRQEALEEAESKSRLQSSEGFLTDRGNGVGAEKAQLMTRGNVRTLRDSFASKERPQPQQDVPLTQVSALRDETIASQESQWSKGEVLEIVHETGEENASLTTKQRESNEKEIRFIKEEDGVKVHSPAEKTEHPIKNYIFANEEKSCPVENSSAIKERQHSENNAFADEDRATIKQDAPPETKRDHRMSDTIAVTEKESCKVRDTGSKDREHTKQEDVRGIDHASVGANATKQKEAGKRTSIQEKTDLKDNGKSDSGTLAIKEKGSKMKQIFKLKEMVKDALSMREHKAKEEVTERQDKCQAKQETTRRNEADHKQPPPHSHIEKNKVKHEVIDRAGKGSIGIENTLSNKIQNNRETTAKDKAKETVGEQTVKQSHKRRPAPPVPNREGLPVQTSHLSVKDTQEKPVEEEMKAHSTLGNAGSRGEEIEQARHVKAPATKDSGEIPPLQHGALSNGESETGAKGRLVTSPVRESTPCKAESATSPNDLDKGGWVRCLIEASNSQTPGPRSDTSSPSTIMPVLFKVKDNTFRSSSLTKTVKAPLHKSFPEEFRLSSPRDSWSGSEKGEDERGRLKERGEVRSPRDASASRRGPHFRITPVKSPTAQPVTAKECRGQEHQRSYPCQEEGESRSAVSTVPEEVEGHAEGAEDIVEARATGFLHTEEAEGSKEPSEKSESVCSAGETQPLGKPPPVLPKTEKALRRAKRLTTKRIKKAEAGGKLERKSRAGLKPVRERQTERPPAPELPPSQPEHDPPHEPQLCPEPGTTQSPQNAVTQPFPLTQRKLLQDPDSGQYFMVDMPVQLKTKTFFDPEMGTYVQIPVRSPEVASSQLPSIDILNSPYLLYPGFVPVPISSLPPQLSASQTPASDALGEDQEKLENSALEKAGGLSQAHCREVEPNFELARVSHDHLPERPFYIEDKDNMNSMNAMSESELDKFTVGNI